MSRKGSTESTPSPGNGLRTTKPPPSSWRCAVTIFSALRIFSVVILPCLHSHSELTDSALNDVARGRRIRVGTRYQGGAAEVRALDALIKLVRCASSLQTRLEAGLRAEGFTATQFGTLEALLHLGSLEPCELGPQLLTSRPSVVLLGAQLPDRGLVRGKPVEGDRRRVKIELTPAGRRTIHKAFQKHARRVARELSALSAAEQEQLGRLCKRLGRPGIAIEIRAKP